MRPMNATWLVVHPESMLYALELVEQGEPAIDVMTKVIDWAHASMEDEDEDAEQ